MSQLADNSAPVSGFSGFAALAVSGADRISFLQGQLTQDVSRISNGQLLRAGALTPQGRVLATLWLYGTADHVVLVLAHDQCEFLATHLHKYILRSQVKLSLNPPGWQAETLTLAQAFLATPLASLTELAICMVQQGFAEIIPATRERYTAQQLNLDTLQAISFDKGCYTGQEIVIRTAHRGEVKRRIQRLRSKLPLPTLQVLDRLTVLNRTAVPDTSATDYAPEIINRVNLRDCTEVLALLPVGSRDDYAWQGHALRVV